ncbi:11-beta-hydroxysteroid dehydrogenase-like 6 [Coffea eugenioides]|uniref:11-beta-hydroxysteroid dehydrogenase-like 6 n=1 Tax=Coffea eugenioides TaxID=49369 RepID=UPI000F613611|nr:11-beta-hydroxysteroid dehydrogenase-like 6 [Coffea eugenioides]
MVQDVNFWESVCPIYFAMPYLKRMKGSIFVSASAGSHLNPPGVSIYAASKAALLSIYETMRAELAPEISITTATLGVIEPEMSKGKYLDREGITQVNSDSASVRYLDLIKMSNFFY